MKNGYNSRTKQDGQLLQVRNELTSATKLVGRVVPNAPQSPAADTPEYAYQYDDIGNRITSTDLGTNRTYTANRLNQYTLISNLCDSASLREEFVPQFDDDGNQTLIQTSTGIWSVQYNGENRPVLWTGGTSSAATNIVMSFDRIGRRVEYRETAGGAQSSATETNAYHRFLYDNYLCIQRLDAANGNAVDLAFVWDITEPVSTRPLIVDKPGVYKVCVTHDGNKNVAELISDNYQVLVHYDYSSFGDVAVSTNATSTLPVNLRTCNPFRFSSEYSDDVLGLSCYNYRHYDSRLGRWNNRDVLFNPGKDIALYCFVRNSPNNLTDLLGLRTCLKWEKSKIAIAAHGFDDENTFDGRAKRSSTKWYPASTGAEMFKVLESYSDRNGPCCKCIEKLHIHSHSSYDSVIMLWNSGFVADWVEYMKRNQEGSEERKKGARLLEGRDVNDLKRAMATGRIVFCDHCVITLFGCNTGKEGGLAHRISEVTDCLIVAPRGSASSANKEGNAVGTNGNRGPEVGGFCDRGWSVWEKGKHHDTKKKSPVFYNH